MALPLRSIVLIGLTALALVLMFLLTQVTHSRELYERSYQPLFILNLVIAGQPWGVVYGFGLWVAKVAVAAQLFDPSTNGFWSQPGNLQLLGQNALSVPYSVGTDRQ